MFGWWEFLVLFHSRKFNSVLILLAVDDGEGKYVLGDTYLSDQVPILSMN